MLKLSLTSRVLDRLGRAFIGNPEALMVPGDFFHVPGDRYIPGSEMLAKPRTIPYRIAVDAFRRRVMTAVAWSTSGYALALCLFLHLLVLAFRAAHH